MMTEDIRRALRDGPRTADEVVDALGLRRRRASAAACRQSIFLQARQGILAKGADGRYYIQREVRSAASKGLTMDDEIAGYLREHGPSAVMEVSAGLGGRDPNVLRRHLARVAEEVGYEGRKTLYALPGETRRRGTRLPGADIEGFLREHGPSTCKEVADGLGICQQNAQVMLAKRAVRLDGTKPYRYVAKEEEP